MRQAPGGAAAFLVPLLFLVFWPPFVFAQQLAGIPRIGYLGAFTPSASAPLLEAFRQGLREIGYTEGRNISIDYRWAEGMPDKLPALATELINLKVDVIVTQSNAAAGALQQVTKTVPVVVAGMGDAVESGFVASLPHPGGNITGFSNQAEDFAGKWLEFLSEAVPTASRVAVLGISRTKSHDTYRKQIAATARPLKISVQRQEVERSDQIEDGFATLVKRHPHALIVLPHAVTIERRAQIVQLASKNKLPAIYPFSIFVTVGGLLSYGADLADLHRRAATHVEKILKGAKVGDIPVEQPTKFELVINLKTARQIGLSLPTNLLARADRVVQ